MSDPQWREQFESSLPTGQPMPSKSSNRGMMFALIGAGVLAVVLIAVGAVALAMTMFQRPSSIPQLLSADTQVYATLTPNLSDIPNVQRLQKAYPELFVDRDSSNADEQLEELLGVTFQQDIAPWIGNEMAFAVSGLEEFDLTNSSLDSDAVEQMAEQADIAIILASRDNEQAQAFLDKQRASRTEQGETFNESAHNNVTIYEQQESDNSPIAAFALVQNNVVFANRSSVITAMLDRDPNGADTLQSSARFTTVKDNLPDTAVGYVYIDGQPLSQFSRASITSALTRMPPDQRDQLEEQMQNVDAFQGIGLSISVIETGVQFDTVMTMDLSKLNEAATVQIEEIRQPVDAAMLATIRDDALALMTFKIPSTLKEQIITAIEVQPGGSEQLAQFEDMYGFDLERDLLDWFVGDAALVLLPGEQMADFTLPMTGYFTIRPQDTAAAEAGMSRIAAAIETASSGEVVFSEEQLADASWQTVKEPFMQQSVGGYSFINDALVIAFGNTAMEGASNGSQSPITANAMFQTASAPLADPNGGVIYVSMDNVLTAYEDFDPFFAESEEAQNLKPIKAISAAGEPGIDANGVARARLFVHIGE